MKIENIDIATVEALHDLLVDKHGYNPEFITLKRARSLIDKLYKIHIHQDFTATPINKRKPFKERLKEEIQKEHNDKVLIKDLQSYIKYTRKEIERAAIDCDNENDYFIVTEPLKQQLRQYEEDLRAVNQKIQSK